MSALEMGIIDLVTWQFGRRPHLTAESVRALVVNRFDWIA